MFKTFFISSRKGILQDIVKYSDFTTEKFLEIHVRMQKAVDSVKPIEEYRDFIGKHRYIFNIYIIVLIYILIYLNVTNLDVNIELDRRLRSDSYLMRTL